jgi:hypothetical protein
MELPMGRQRLWHVCEASCLNRVGHLVATLNHFAYKRTQTGWVM